MDAWRTKMPRHNFREIVLMVLAMLIGLGTVLLIGHRLFYVTASSIPPANGGVAFVVVSGVSVKVFTMLIVAVVAFVVMLAVILWKR
jgi:hypothetical protein